MKFFIYLSIVFLVSCGNLKILKSVDEKTTGKPDKNIDMNIIQDGIYYAYKFCSMETKVCKTISPQIGNRGYYLKRYEDPKQNQYYILVKDNKYYLYSMEYVSEDVIVYWSVMNRNSSEHLLFSIDRMNQIMGLPQASYVNRPDIENMIYEKTGVLKIGDFPVGVNNDIKQTIQLIKEDNDYTIECDTFVRSLTELNKSEQAQYGGHFNTLCIYDKQNIYFKKVD